MARKNTSAQEAYISSLTTSGALDAGSGFDANFGQGESNDAYAARLNAWKGSQQPGAGGAAPGGGLGGGAAAPGSGMMAPAPATPAGPQAAASMGFESAMMPNAGFMGGGSGATNPRLGTRQNRALMGFMQSGVRY